MHRHGIGQFQLVCLPELILHMFDIVENDRHLIFFLVYPSDKADISVVNTFAV